MQKTNANLAINMSMQLYVWFCNCYVKTAAVQTELGIFTYLNQFKQILHMLSYTHIQKHNTAHFH